MAKLIYLTGFMGSGKSTTGKKLAKLLHFSFMDLDNEIENRYRITIPSIFSRFDEDAFRKIEHETLKQTFSLKNHVIATGGGTPCFYNNMEMINNNGVSVYLQMNPKSLHGRLTNSKKKRPLIEHKPPNEILEYIEQQLWKRDFFYTRAHHTIEAENLDINELVKILRADIR